MTTDSYARFQAEQYLDSTFARPSTKNVMRRLLEELREQDEQIAELRQANQSFGDVFDKIAPTMEEAVKQARRYGAEKALHNAGVISENELTQAPEVLPLPAPEGVDGSED